MVIPAKSISKNHLFLEVIDVVIPEGATIHFYRRNGAEYTNAVNLPYNTDATDIILVPNALPSGAGAKFYLLHITFFQEVNVIQYPLNNGGYNALAIIAMK